MNDLNYEWITEGKIGETGGFGSVYKTRKKIGKTITPKVLAKKVLNVNDEEAIERFKKEVRICKRLNHPNVVKIVDEHLKSEPYYYIMKLYDHSLSNVIYGLKNDLSQMRFIFNSIFDGVDYLHTQNVLHRDLKPQNILLKENNEVVVADLGLGVQATSNSERLTVTGIYMGTEFYMSPEQKKDSKRANERTDIYSLGCILYQALVGDFDYILDYTKVPSSFEYVIKKATFPSANDRFTNIKELKDAFNSALDLMEENNNLTFGDELINKINLGTDNLNFIGSLANYLSKNLHDSDYIHDLIMKIKVNQLKLLEEKYLETLKKIIRNFKDTIINQAWGFDYTDSIGRKCNMLIRETKDENIISDLIIILVQLGCSHNRWYVMNLAKENIYNLKNETVAFILSEELKYYCSELDYLDLEKDRLMIPLRKIV